MPTPHEELAAFLRFHRERVSPADLGLPDGGRRRTPGLRREEVAVHSGVSATWYTFLEQGRDVSPSPQVLGALARTLRMSPAERAYLFALAGQPAAPRDAVQDVHPTLRALLTSIEPSPAHLTNRVLDVLAYNRAQAALLVEYDRVPPAERNVMWQMFTHPSTRDVIVGWEDEARAMIARFRATAAEYAADPRMATLIRDLQEASPEFRKWWPGHDVQDQHPARKRIDHPLVGLVELDYVKLEVTGAPGQLLTVHVPADEISAARLRDLTAAYTARNP